MLKFHADSDMLAHNDNTWK